MTVVIGWAVVRQDGTAWRSAAVPLLPDLPAAVQAARGLSEASGLDWRPARVVGDIDDDEEAIRG